MLKRKRFLILSLLTRDLCMTIVYLYFLFHISIYPKESQALIQKDLCPYVPRSTAHNGQDMETT